MAVIAISGQPGAGSTTTAKLLAEKLQHSYFSPGRVFKDISRGTLKEQFYYSSFKQQCDLHQLIIPDFASSNDTQGVLDLWHTDLGKDPRLHTIIDYLQKKIASEGNAVLDGKLSLHMIPTADLKIWLKASRARRAERTSQRDTLPTDDAEKRLEERETHERREWASMYGIDYWSQESMAHRVIDTTDKTPRQVAAEIESLLVSHNKL